MFERRIFIFTAAFLIASAAWSQTLIFSESFTTGIPATWTMHDGDALVPATAVDTFDNAWIPFIYDGDTCAASTSYYDPAGQSADFLITPKISIDTYSKLVWSARSYDASYPDGYVVLISATDSLPGSFTDTIFVKDAENTWWQTRSVQLDLEGYANQDVYFAFKNITNNGFVLMLDEVKVTTSDFAFVSESPETALTIYPNPVSNQLNVLNFSAGDQLEIYSLCGSLIFVTSDQQVDVTRLSPGFYTYVIRSQNGTSTSGILTKSE